jgi:hypothetical protein
MASVLKAWMASTLINDALRASRRLDDLTVLVEDLCTLCTLVQGDELDAGIGPATPFFRLHVAFKMLERIRQKWDGVLVCLITRYGRTLMSINSS